MSLLCPVRHGLLRLQNDLYCVGWGVKLYSPTRHGLRRFVTSEEARLILTQISVVNFSRLSGLSAASASDRVYDIDGPASAECQASVGLLYELNKN